MASEKSSGIVPHPRTPQRERGRIRVAALMASAAELFVEKGFDATTMTEIAAKAGASIGTLYLFFPTKEGLAEAILKDNAEDLSNRLDQLAERSEGLAPNLIVEAVFDLLREFLAGHPAYSALLDLSGDAGWRRTMKTRRRQQIAAVFAKADPPLPHEQAERIAVIVPQLMRIPLTLVGEKRLREGIVDELRQMLMRHLAAT